MNSSLAKERYPAHRNNYYGTRGCKIDRIIIHYMYAKWTAKRCCESFQDPKRGASSNYCIGYNGEIAVSVDEEYASGCSTNKNADCHGVTIETANDSMIKLTHSDATMKSLIALCADIAKRNGLGKLVPGKNLCWHNMYAATSCPGQFLLDRMDYIAASANEINGLNEKPSGAKGQLAGVNIHRAADTIVMYTAPLKAATTNAYGYEFAVDQNGVIIDRPAYGVGKMKIPTNGRVYSGHGKGCVWLKERAHKGAKVWVENGQIYITYGKQHMSIDSVNKQRGSNQLCIYDTGTKANTNKWGTEVAIVNGVATCTPIYGIGKMAIPKGGYVLSGHGKASEWILSYIRKGSKIKYDGHTICVDC